MGHHHSHSSHGHSDEGLGHIVPKNIYLTVLLCLLVLTFITVWVAQYNFGNWNIVVAMLVASVKAGLVGMFFMHLKYESKVIWLYVLFPIVLLFIMLGGIFIDNPLRIDAIEMNKTGQNIADAELVVAAPDHATSKAHH